MSDEIKAEFRQWCIVELMGHIRMAGLVTEEQRFGATVGRIDIPGPDDTFVTQYFNGSVIYRVTPTTEDIARQVARAGGAPAPVNIWTLRLPAPEDEQPEEDEL